MASTRLYSEALEQFQANVLSSRKDANTQKLLHDFILDGKSNFSTPAAAKAACHSLATDTGQKYGSIKIGKVEVVPKVWVDAVMSNIDSIVAAGSLMTKNAPESIGVAWYAISLCLKAIGNNYSLYALFGKGLTDITEVMIIILHYDRVYDRHQKPDSDLGDIVQKLFRDTISTYVAVLDFSFSVKKHMSGDTVDKIRHGIKDFFGAQAPKFQGKLNHISVLKGKILESSQGAFQDQSLQQFSEVRRAIEKVQAHQSQVYELQLEQHRMLTAVQDDLKDIKDAIKRKTPFEYLLDEFMANKKKLDPLPEPQQSLRKLVEKRHEKTCEWIFENELYQEWASSPTSSLMCLIGPPGCGKSTVLASLIQKWDNAETQPRHVNYTSCDAKDAAQSAGIDTMKLGQYCNTLLYQIYSLAVQGDENIALLEQCNQIFRNPKEKQVGNTYGREAQDDGPTEFVETMVKLISTVKRDVVLVLDAVGNLGSDDQIQLHQYVKDLIMQTSDGPRISVLVGSRQDSDFVHCARGESTACIEFGSSNTVSSDMALVLGSRLQELHELSESEKKQAKESILAKASSRFSYIDEIALPYLRQPFKRPIAAYLDKLPESLSEGFEQALQAMPPNYLELLKLAVTWTMLAPRPVSVKEVMEAYSGVYTDLETSLEDNITTEDDYEQEATSLEIQQIMRASGPFLSIERSQTGQHVINLQDARQVKAFCERPVASPQASNADEHRLCENCKTHLLVHSSLEIDRKTSHLELALMSLRHLNSPLFQRRHGLLRDASQGPPPAATTTGNENSDSTIEQKDFATASVEDTSSEQEADVLITEDLTVHEESKPLTAMVPVTTTNSAELDEEKTTQEEANNTDRYTEPSIDEDVSALDYQHDVEPDAWTGQYLFNRRPELRSEINSWAYHLRRAEAAWSAEEKQESEVWQKLIEQVRDELRKFTKSEAVLGKWQHLWGLGYIDALGYGLMSPLYLAGILGLSTWVEDLVKQGADLFEETPCGNIVQASACFSAQHGNVELLRFLLERGADMYYKLEDWIIGYQMWLDRCSDTKTVVSLMVKHGVDFDVRGSDEWSGLHSLAWSCENVEAFNIVMKSEDLGKSKRPDINALDEKGETPLHRLLWRREVPIDLLEAFLATDGIDVNRDDSHSQQPLSVASTWGSLNVVQHLLVAGADVHDDDDSGCTALHAAAAGGHVKCIEALISAQSELERRDKGGSTPLQHAAYHGRKAVVELLLSKGSDLNSTNNHNRTPFFNATRCLEGGSETALFLLQELKTRGYATSEINKITTGRRTPLRQAAAHGFTDVLQELLRDIVATDDPELKDKINLPDERLKQGPLHCAVKSGNAECVRLLLEHGADAMARDIQEQTPLMLAEELWVQRNESSYSFEEILLQLIEADHEAAVADAELPAIAAASGSLRILQKLHELRADLSRNDSFGWTPLAHARQSGHRDCEHFLKHGTSWGGALPSRWIDNKGHADIGLDERGLQVDLDDKLVNKCIVSNRPLPPDMQRFYFEITLARLENEHIVAMGFCTLGVGPHDFPGWPPKKTAPSAMSWAYHGDDGGFYCALDWVVAGNDDPYGAGDTVGCGVDLEHRKIWFTKNGKRLKHEFHGVRGRLFPILGLKSGVKLTTNFGREPFLWKDEQLANGLGGT